MIHVVQANPAMDRIEVLPTLEPNAVNRAARTHALPGGKGLNVARGIRQLGGEVSAYGPLGGWVGGYIREACGDLGIDDRHTAIAGTTRICTIVVETDTGRSTVLNELGPEVAPGEISAMVRELVPRCSRGDLVALTGSLPPGVADTCYAEIVDAVQATGARAILDSAGEPLRLAMSRGPWMIKPNQAEFREALGMPAGSGDGELLDAMCARLGSGTEIVVVTQGARGLVVVTPQVRWRVRVPSIRTVNPTGSGDFFLAGFATGLERGRDLAGSVRFGAACAVANAMSVIPEIPGGVDLEGLGERVTLEEV
jgi:1-phosphofructokinase family hexose kinase